jgi:hypothetical protein
MGHRVKAKHGLLEESLYMLYTKISRQKEEEPALSPAVVQFNKILSNKWWCSFSLVCS